MNGSLVVVFLVFAIGLVCIIVAKPNLRLTQVGRIFVFVSLFIVPVLAALMGASRHIEHSKTTQFCLSCHVMEPYGKSLLVNDSEYVPANHYQNIRVPREAACYSCHTNYAMYGDIKSKMRGLKHVYVYYIGTIPKKIELYEPFNNRECLHCHAGARTFEEGATHNEEPEKLAQIKANKVSCTSSGCHNVIHNVDSLSKADFWKEIGK